MIPHKPLIQRLMRNTKLVLSQFSSSPSPSSELELNYCGVLLSPTIKGRERPVARFGSSIGRPSVSPFYPRNQFVHAERDALGQTLDGLQVLRRFGAL